MQPRRNANHRDGAAGKEAPTGRTGPVFTPAPRPGGPRNRVPSIVKKRGDGLERRPPAGIARERETSADDVALCQAEGRVFFMTGGVGRRWGFLPVGAFRPAQPAAGERKPRHPPSRLATAEARSSNHSHVAGQASAPAGAIRGISSPRSRPAARGGAGRRPAFQAVPALLLGPLYRSQPLSRRRAG